MSEDTSNATAERSAQASRYLTFQLGAEAFGIEILKVQEIIGLMSVTHVPRTPPYVRGVINLRGKIIPIVDLRVKFELTAREDTERTCIIVVQVTSADIRVTMGMLVDEVSEVSDIKPDQMEPPPSFGAAIDTDFILGMGKLGQKVIMLLDVDRILSTSEIGTIAAAQVHETID